MILVFDTSTSHLAIGIADPDGNSLREYHSDAPEKERGIHDARLAAETANLLHNLGIVATEISRIGLIIGPGSFTGLRIGLSFAKGLCFATGASIIPLTQHEVLHEGMKDANYIITPGYQPELFYFAEASTPKEIRLLKKDELWKIPERLTIAHDLFQTNHIALPWPCMYAAPSLAIMAKLTAQSEAFILPEDIDRIEPLYITEFKPGGRN